MEHSYSIHQEANPRDEELAIIRNGLDAYNAAYTGAVKWDPLVLLVKSFDGKVAGGLLGGTYWGWLYVETLWLAEDARQQRLGSRLLAKAEAIARERGCHAAHLDTMSFQALPFYRRHGYSVFGVLDDMPMGHKRYFLRKDLRAEQNEDSGGA